MSAPEETESNPVPFADLGLSPAVMKAVESVGYETPSPIQAQTLPPLLAGHDVMGQAQTGTGKTAAFALPILSAIEAAGASQHKAPQALVLAPTRELAIQVAEAFQRYAEHIDGFHVLPIYGGQGYGPQLSALKRGVDVVVGTPGRVMDHLKRGTLSLEKLDWMVLDEADEMLRMGFIEDVEWIFENTPPTRQVALFSATMPSAIRRIAKTHLRDAQEITIKNKTSTATNIHQRYWLVSGGVSKLDGLTRLLEAEPFDAVLVFARTKKATDELAEKLTARGYACAALNGDVAQQQRERIVNRLKKKQLDILVATDVAARGLDVERISHVINFDIPHDPESYVHRIGRTGRAGRSGDAILFVTSREKRLFKAIERSTGQPIEPMNLPTTAEISEQRVDRFKQRIGETLDNESLDQFRTLVADYQEASGLDALELAAALAFMAQGDDAPLTAAEPHTSESAGDSGPGFGQDTDKSKPKSKKKRTNDDDLETYRIEVGKKHGAQARNIVGAITNEAGLNSADIGRINIQDEHSTIDLPQGMTKDVFAHLKTVWVADQQLAISRVDGASGGPSGDNRSKGKTAPKHKKPNKPKGGKPKQ